LNSWERSAEGAADRSPGRKPGNQTVERVEPATRAAEIALAVVNVEGCPNTVNLSPLRGLIGFRNRFLGLTPEAINYGSLRAIVESSALRELIESRS